jgi:nitroreductase
MNTYQPCDFFQVNRRRFVKGLFAGAVAGAAGSLLYGCGGMKRNPPSPFESIKGIRGLDEAGYRMLYLASLAPSGHNSQPWVVRVLNKRKWIIGADPDRRLPSVDSHDREMILSVGAFVENLAIAADAMGFAADLEISAEGTPTDAMVSVDLKKKKPGNYPLKRLTTRRTVKNGFLNRDLKPADVGALSEPLPGNFVYFPTGSRHAACIQEGTIECFRIQTRRDDAQQELVKWLRFTPPEIKKHRDGLTLNGLEIGGLTGWYMRHFMTPRDLLKPDMRRQGVEKTAELAMEGGGWIVITSRGDTVADYIDTGRRFEKMALVARERMIGIHPMTQFLEEEEGKKAFVSDHGASIHPQFILRVGYLEKYPAPMSPRRPVEWFIRS